MTGGGGLLVVGEPIAAFMHYPGDQPLEFHGPFPSGAPVIFASAAARLGARVELAATVGDDVFGRQFSERLAADGVSSAAMAIDPRRPTAAAFVSYDTDGRRDYVFYLNGTAALSTKAAALDRAGRARWLHVSGSTIAFGGATAETAWEAVRRALAADIPISFDPNVRSVDAGSVAQARVSRLLDVAHVVFASAGELEALGRPAEALLAAGAVVCHKAGSSGAVIRWGEECWEIPAPAVEEVDPDGAGDIFAAGFVAASLAGAGPRESGEVGVQIASASVAVRGPLSSSIQSLPAYLAGVA